MKPAQWFDVDRDGLAKILRRRGIEFAVYELIQNSWDEKGVTRVDVTLERISARNARLTIQDDAPAGFNDLAHAFTLFAESTKKANAEQRGRFNLGEKLVIALCDEYRITSTTGGITFDEKGRHRTRATTPKGTRIECVLKLNQTEREQIEAEVKKLIPPEGIATYFNEVRIESAARREIFVVTLPTEIADGEGNLRRATRQTQVELYPVQGGASALICEMGIPVVEHDCAFTVNVMQKVPVTMDRENVSPQFLRSLRVALFNRTHDQLSTEDVNSSWITEAIESPDATPEAVKSFVLKRFGEKVVSFDPSDPEANKIAASAGYTVVTGGMLKGAAWQNVKSAGAIIPAGQVMPSARAWSGEDNPNAKICHPIPPEQWTPQMRDVAVYAGRTAELVLGRRIAVDFYSTPHLLAAAAYGSGTLQFNKMRLGGDWFDLKNNRLAIDDLLIHEFGHEYSGDHLSADYYKALTRIGAKMVQCAREGKMS